MQLPIKLPLEIMQPQWASIINPILAIPMLAGNQIDFIVLIAGVPQAINHLLSRMPQGWFIVDINQNTAVWKTQPFNKNTITLQSTSTVTISIWVY